MFAVREEGWGRPRGKFTIAKSCARFGLVFGIQTTTGEANSQHLDHRKVHCGGASCDLTGTSTVPIRPLTRSRTASRIRAAFG